MTTQILIDGYLCEVTQPLSDENAFGTAFCPTRDFLGHSGEGVTSTLHFALDSDTLAAVNAFSHFPLCEEIHSCSVGASAHALSQSSEGQTHHSAGLLSAASLAISSHLSAQQKEDLQALLEEFSSIFSLNSDDLGVVAPHLSVQHRIDTGDAQPVTQRGYKHSHHECEFLQETVEKLLLLGVIRESTSPWLSPTVLVKKKDRTLRLCIDYRAVNKVTVLDAYQLPLIEERLADMAGCRYFSSLDILSAFWQIPMATEDIPKTAFTTPFGNFEWLRMPFGLVNATSTFQRFMDTVLKPCRAFCFPYVDDVISYDNSWEQHLMHLRSVFTELQISGLKVKLSKCIFGAPCLATLGRVVSEAGIHTDPDKVRAILDLPAPTSATLVKSFLGMAGFYRAHIERFSHIAQPLNALTKQGVPFVWNHESQAAFEALKDALVTAPILAMPDWTQPFLLHTDWSKTAVGAVLSQQHPATGFVHPIAYASRACTVAESHYAPTEGELLALVWATHKFRPYLDGHAFTVYTDHAALQWLESARFQNSKLERWALRLQEFSFTVQYTKGPDNVVADCLSRAVAAFIAECPAAAVNAIWPDHAKQQDLDAIPCTTCGDPGGWDNMVLCDRCDRTFHLRCLLPPQTIPPSGSWLCPACDPDFINVDELYDANPALNYRPGDPHLDVALLDFLAGGRIVDSGTPKTLIQRAQKIKLHHLNGWLMVLKKIRGLHPRWLVCPPLHFRWDTIRMLHEALGHAGISQTLAVMHQHFHWAGIKADIAQYIKCCDACQRRKLILPELPDMQPPVIHGPLKHVHIDLAGPFKTPAFSLEGKLDTKVQPHKSWVVLMVDYFTKVAEFAVIPGKEPQMIARAFWNLWLTRYGTPTHLTSDNGTEFATDFAHMISRLSIEHIHTSAFHPAANGAVERLVKSFKAILSAHVNNHPNSWVQALPSVRMAYMNRIHSVLKVSPNEMLMGYPVQLPLPAAAVYVAQKWEGVPPAGPSMHNVCHEPLQVVPLVDPVEANAHIQAVQERLMHLDEETLEQIATQFRSNQAALSMRRERSMENSVKLEIGDWVLELDATHGPLNSYAKGPYRILGFKQQGAIAQLQTGATALKDSRLFERHVSRLARYFNKFS